MTNVNIFRALSLKKIFVDELNSNKNVNTSGQLFVPSSSMIIRLD
jgi:hypothetical protein